MTPAHKSSPHIWLNKYFTVTGRYGGNCSHSLNYEREGRYICRNCVCVEFREFSQAVWNLTCEPRVALMSLHPRSELCTFIQRHFLFSPNKYLRHGLGFQKKWYRTEQACSINIRNWHEIRFEVHSAALGLIKHVTHTNQLFIQFANNLLHVKNRGRLEHAMHVYEFLLFSFSTLTKPIEQKLPGTCSPPDLTWVDWTTGRESFREKITGAKSYISTEPAEHGNLAMLKTIEDYFPTKIH